MKTYILVDLSNLFFRARWAMNASSNDDHSGIACHVVISSIKKAWNDFNGSHVVICNEGKSWRKAVYPAYKANRAAKRAAMTIREQADEQMFWETLEMFKEYIETHTNCTVLQHPNLEADDLIAGFIQSHPNDRHVIISTDSDYYQLMNENVFHYNGVSEVLTTVFGFFDVKGNPIIDPKTKQEKEPPNPEWLLFEKCIRGDTSDNIFSAYPGVRKKGTKSKTGLIECFDDRVTKGWAWNNVMNQTWKDHNGIIHTVREDYERNKMLIDLSAQPDDVKINIFETIVTNTVPKDIPQIGTHFLKFCGRNGLASIARSPQGYLEPLVAKYC